ncbi:hypothetical protein [Singulisphaera acidiphila]|nr:hypothetical protein [Singulisphaera acidiphila]
MTSCLTASTSAPALAAVWFARSKATGDGMSGASPIGSSAALDAATKPGDIIILMPGETPFDGGVALKVGQTLMGLIEGDRKPSITNTDGDQHGGNGVVLADDSRVLDVRIERTKASGVLGVDVSGTSLLGVEVEDANQSAGFTTAVTNVLGRISHGGILFIAAQPGKAVENRVLHCTATRATGIGIGAFALKGGRSRLVVSHIRVEGGALIPPLFDIGVTALADGRSSEMSLEMADADVRGRLSPQGRNVLVFASAEAKAKARIERSTMGEVGQDGVVAVAARVPATVAIEIRDSTIEKAGQMNIEGTILNLPPSDPARAHESVVSIDVEGSIIRDVGFVDGFRGEAQNIWLAPTVFAPGPFAKGRYRLSVRNSVVEKAIKAGIGLGNTGSEFGISSDEGEYQVRLRNNTIRDNGASEITIAASRTHVDARRNYWGIPTGLAKGRVVLLDKADRSQLDASQPLTRPSEGSRLRSGGPPE